MSLFCLGRIRGSSYPISNCDDPFRGGPALDRMRPCLRLKVDQYPELLHLPRRTGDTMPIENCTSHPWESAEFWGAVRRGGEWHGQNVLGCLWMEIRIESQTLVK